MASYLSQSATTTLFHHVSLCSRFHSSHIMSELYISPFFQLSFCQMGIHLSSDFSSLSVHPFTPTLALWLCVICVCLFSGVCLFVDVLFSALIALCISVCICLCQISICAPPPLPPFLPLSECVCLYVNVCGVNQGQWGFAGPHLLPPSHTHKHTHRVCVFCPSSHLDVLTASASAQFSPGSAQLCGLITEEPTASLTSAIRLIEI